TGEPVAVVFGGGGGGFKGWGGGHQGVAVSSPRVGRRGRSSLVVVGFRPRWSRGFDFVCGGFHGTSARAATKRRAKSACAPNKIGFARGSTIPIPPQGCFCPWHQSPFLRPRLRDSLLC